MVSSVAWTPYRQHVRLLARYNYDSWYVREYYVLAQTPTSLFICFSVLFRLVNAPMMWHFRRALNCFMPEDRFSNGENKRKQKTVREPIEQGKLGPTLKYVAQYYEIVAQYVCT